MCSRVMETGSPNRDDKAKQSVTLKACKSCLGVGCKRWKPWLISRHWSAMPLLLPKSTGTPLAWRRDLPTLRIGRHRQARQGRNPTRTPTLRMQRLPKALRRLDGDRSGRPPPTVEGLDTLPVFHGVEPFQPADRPRAGLEQG